MPKAPFGPLLLDLPKIDPVDVDAAIKTLDAEDPATIVARAEEALRYFPPERIFLNPDCGFGCFANRCVNEEEVAVAKLRSMVAAARVLRERHG